MSRHRQPGRRRAPGRVKRLPDGLSRHGAALAAKSIAGLGVVGGAAVALSLPLDASADAATAAPASVSLASAPAAALADRAPAQRASRSAVRSSPAAVTAPAGLAPSRPTVVGISGITAVATPKPAPKKSAPAASGTTRADAYTGGVSAKCASLGLIPNAQRICTAIQANFGLSNIGGYRAGDGDHGTGQAVDFMISGQAQGDAIAAWVQQHVGQFNVEYVIWRQRYWEPGGAWRLMEDRGSPTANHYDHVHVTVRY